MNSRKSLSTSTQLQLCSNVVVLIVSGELSKPDQPGVPGSAAVSDSHQAPCVAAQIYCVTPICYYQPPGKLLLWNYHNKLDNRTTYNILTYY